MNIKTEPTKIKKEDFSEKIREDLKREGLPQLEKVDSEHMEQLKQAMEKENGKGRKAGEQDSKAT